MLENLLWCPLLTEIPTHLFIYQENPHNFLKDISKRRLQADDYDAKEDGLAQPLATPRRRHDHQSYFLSVPDRINKILRLQGILLL